MSTALLGDIANLEYGFAFDSKRFNSDGRGLPLVRIRDVVPGRSSTYYEGEFADRYLVETGDLLIGMDGQFNLASWRGGTALLNQRVCRIGKTERRVHRRYLFHFLPSALKRVEDATPFATVKHLSARVLKGIEVPLPPIEEQRRIAAILDRAAGLIKVRRQSLKGLQLVGDAVIGRLLASEAAAREVPLSQLAEIRIGPFGSLLHRDDYVPDGVPLVNPMHIVDGRIVPNDNYLVSQEKMSTLRRYQLRRGDVVMGRRGEMGRCAVVGEQEDGFLCGTGSLIVRPKTSSARAVFLQRVLSHSSTVRSLEARARGVTMLNLNTQILENLPVPNVGLQQQDRLLEGLAALEARRDQMELSHANLVEQLDSLQARAFSGRL
ncbi:restriction endonuclease subunit S [Knoellia locipacati]|uniref:restriction endonuclease subunit S n=1 Tax=Knoellia locipacati TaxID=882824 RepID=UPI00384B9500